MSRLFLIVVFLSQWTFVTHSQSLTVSDLLTLSAVPPKNVAGYMSKKGFLPAPETSLKDITAASFIEKKKTKRKNANNVSQRLDLYTREDVDFFVLHLSSVKEYSDGCNWLRKAGFFSNSADTIHSGSMLFQKNNIRVEANRSNAKDPEFSLVLQKKELPKAGDVQYADDLLKFTSHEFLVAFFGSKSVKRDVYYFSEHELKQCSVLFPNSDRQAIFIWDDEGNLSELSYILISGISPAVSASNYTASISQNKWALKNGIYSSMPIKELWELNGDDFQFYGRHSGFSFMIPPDNKGNIDFKKIGLTLGCLNCNGSMMLEKLKISASEAIANSLALYVDYIMIMPDGK